MFHHRHNEPNMRVLLLFLFCFTTAHGLKCRSAAESQQTSDFEYVVRMCLRHMRNESDMPDLYRFQNDYDSGRNKRHRDEMSGDNSNDNDNRNHFNRNRKYPEGYDRFWPSNNHDRPCFDSDRNRQDGDYEESDFFGPNRNGNDGRKKFKVRSQMPHSYQQQLQHDRDVLYNRGNRDSSYFFANRNKNTKFTFNKDKNNDSPLAEIDPCVIHCIFQEMQMVDENGKPNKGMISQKMTQKIRNSELRNFIQESVDECFDVIDYDDSGMSYIRGNSNNNNNNTNNNNNNNNNNRYRRTEMTCEWAKTFAMCLEEKGRENCDDWNDPLQKNHSNSNNNSNGNNKNEDQRHKSKQNDRG